MPFLSDSDREALLRVARDAVHSAVARTAFPQIPNSAVFSEICGVFVTLHVAGLLRGCIGVVQPREPLSRTVPDCAASAALNDPRFPPLQLADLPDLDVEISLLSSATPIPPDSIQVGLHGLLIDRDGHRGLLLPQVATEHHLDRERFLAETCRKAGLPPDAWRDPRTRILAFTCELLHSAHSPSR